MRALVVTPGHAKSGRLLEVPEPSLSDGTLLVQTIEIGLGDINRRMVLENDVVFGSVNANRSHYELAADALAKVDHAWLSRLITRRVALGDWQQAFIRQTHDIKVILDFDGHA
jgi:Glucose dehydrogenase C-terminus